MRNAVKGLRQSMDLLRHNVEQDAEEIGRGIIEVDELRKVAKSEVHETLQGVRSDLQEVRDFVNDMRGSNGGGSLGNSSGQSETSGLPRSSEVTSK